MWILLLIATIIAGYLLVRHFVDRETKKKLSFLLKALLILLSILILLGVVVSINNK